MFECLSQRCAYCCAQPRYGSAFWRSVRRFFAHFLFVLAAWTLVIKWALPVVWALNEGVSPVTYIYWDFWWVIHILLGLALLFGYRYLLIFVIVVSILEIGIVTMKFTLFLSHPEWTIWTMNWFVNKLFVLAVFIMLLLHALCRKKVYTS